MLGVITLSDRNFLSELTGSNLLTGACYALVISSAIVCLLALFGCFGAAKEIKCMLLTVSLWRYKNRSRQNKNRVEFELEKRFLSVASCSSEKQFSCHSHSHAYSKVKKKVL